MIDANEPKRAFDINYRDDGSPGAKLPMLGIRSQHPLHPQFGVHDVDSYLSAMHAVIGDATNVVRNGFAEAAKALGADVPQAYSYASMSFMPDPSNYGLVSWPGIAPEALRKVSRECVAPQMVIRSRVNDLARYSGLSSHLWQPGWRIVMREARETPSSEDKKDIRDAERFIWNCSRDASTNDARERDAQLIAPFEMFLRSFADDALTFDGWAIWTDMTASGNVRAFANLPAGMIRLAVPTRGYKGNPKWFACLIDETGNPIKPFTRQELTWRVRNVRNDPSVMGYGWSEIEMAIRLIQGFQAGLDLNIDTFTTNGIPNGMLLLKGDYFQQEQIDALMREWTNMKRGVSKLWGMPVMAIPSDGEVEILQFMDLKGEDVRYKDHLNMMAGLTCLIYNFPVRRLGMFVSGNHKDNQVSSDASIEIQGADDSGLPALLMHIENTINDYLLMPNWKHLKFEFLNKNPKEDARSFQERKIARTWGEARAEADLPKLSTVYGDELGPLADIMDGCPEDPVKAAVFQTVAVTMLQAQLGMGEEGEGGNKSPASPGARSTPQKDPAKSQGHGHLGGVRRNSRAEKDKP